MWRVEFKDRAHGPGERAKERRFGRASSKQELPGDAALAKEMFTLRVTQIPSPVEAPRSPRGSARSPGTGFIPVGIWPPGPQTLVLLPPLPWVPTASFAGTETTPLPLLPPRCSHLSRVPPGPRRGGLELRPAAAECPLPSTDPSGGARAQPRASAARVHIPASTLREQRNPSARAEPKGG